MTFGPGVHPLRHGPLLFDDGTVEFRVWAPDAESVDLVLHDLEADWVTSKEALLTEQNDLVKRIKELNNFRREHVQSIPSQYMAAYDSVMKRSDGSAVVQLSRNRCRGCLVTVPANTIKTAYEGKLVYCDSCGRILSPA
jgi:predicted  nucleic acid-binding Zn-ribbon protein